jgi:hypothetical protein
MDLDDDVFGAEFFLPGKTEPFEAKAIIDTATDLFAI